MRKLVLFFLTFVTSLNCYCQSNTVTIDSTKTIDSTSCSKKFKSLIIPTALITYGVAGFRTNFIKDWNIETKDKFGSKNKSKLTIDDYSQYAPIVAVYVLNNIGVKGKHNLKDRTVILSTSLLLTFISVKALKNGTSQQRPDETDKKSFPSGHTALAFAGAEFLFQEYKDVSIWYGISGYVVASATGLLRIYNNKHWLTDVAAGAGIGILCTKTAYWIHPFINKHLFPSKNNKSSAMVSPFYDGRNFGGSFVVSF